MSRTPVLAALAAAAALLLTACSGGGLGVFGGDEGNGSSGSSARPTLTPRPGIVLSSNSTAKLGTVVIDGLGFTLYRFDEDSANPPTSTCTDACTQTWQPVIYTDPVTLEGVEQGEVGKLARADGQQQVTIGGWPVYRYLPEPQPGATEGHGSDGAWFAITPDGKKATANS
jgi:predicted lipoprotein with Yx(FWY)xxD motif